MSIESLKNKVVGTAKEELFEHIDGDNAERIAQEGRDQRNLGRIQDGELPKVTKPGTGN